MPGSLACFCLVAQHACQSSKPAGLGAISDLHMWWAGTQAAAADEAATQDPESMVSPDGIALDNAPETQEQLFAVRPAPLLGLQFVLKSSGGSSCAVCAACVAFGWPATGYQLLRTKALGYFTAGLAACTVSSPDGCKPDQCAQVGLTLLWSAGHRPVAAAGSGAHSGDASDGAQPPA